MRRLHQVIAVTGLIAFLSGPVAFAIPLLDIDGGSTLNLPASHDILAENTEGLINANLKTLADVVLTFTYLGKEAAWTNILLIGGSEVFRTGPGNSEAGDTSPGSASAGDPVDFTLQVLVGGNAPSSVSNGTNVAPAPPGSEGFGPPNFWLGYANAARSAVWVGFDDGGAASDGDYDDLVFRISAVTVPEPGTFALLVAGLFGLGTMRRRRTTT